MRITRIKKLQNLGIFHNFEWGELPEFARLNLIYGQNGSGKTTLSRVLRNLERGEVPPEGEVVISTDEPGDIRGGDFSRNKVPVRVFNSDFVKDSVFSVERQGIPPIIVLGQKSKKKQDLLAKKREDLKDAKHAHDARLGERDNAKKDLDLHCKTQSQLVKELLRGPGDSNNYGNYNVVKYKKGAVTMINNGDAAEHLLDDETQNELLAIHQSVPKPEILEPTYPQLDMAALRAKVVNLLSRTAASGAIGSLRDDPDRAEWVRRGIALRSNDESACPFCEQQVPEQRESDLRLHFSAEYEDVTRSLDGLEDEIKGIAASYLSEIVAPECEIVYEPLIDRYRDAKAALDAYRDHVKEYLDSLTHALTSKRGRPFDPVPPDGILPPPGSGSPERLAGIIREHNDICRNFTNRVKDAGKRLESWHVARSIEEFKQLCDNFAAACKAAEESKDHVAALNAEVAELEREISSHSRPADDFNGDLRQYLGHGEMRLAVRENGYEIVRGDGGDLLPSEGEKTAIALLYFLTSLKDDKFDMDNGVVVLDDPVSSLDANTLFSAYGFVRERTRSAGQLFILTHNFTFFREVRNWFKKTKNRKDSLSAQFYMLDRASNGQDRHSEICKLDPLLRNYGSDYHYLFACVWRGARSGRTLKSYYPLPNMARRLLEAFLAFRRPDLNHTFGSNMRDIDFDKIGLGEAKRERILNFVNAHSHSASIAGPENNIELLAETPNALCDIMSMMKAMDKGHYEMMENLVKKSR